MVEEARALPPAAHATHYADLFAKIATLEAANAANAADVAAATAKAEAKDEDEDRENTMMTMWLLPPRIQKPNRVFKHRTLQQLRI
jgi:hypothetical protein